MLRQFVVVGFAVAATATAQTPINLPALSSTYTFTHTRGFWFRCPVNCVITGLEVPNEAAQPNQVVEVIDLGTTPPPVFPPRSGVQRFYDNATPSGTRISTSITLTAGRFYGVLGGCNDSLGSSNTFNSLGRVPFTSSILGHPTVLTQLAVQSGIASNGGNQPVATSASSLGRVFVDIVPVAGVFADFSSDVTTGPSPLTVNFMDATVSTPNPITSWAWDFDNDGTIDSTTENPTHTYTTCGVYDVALTVDDGSGPITTTKTAYISTDNVSADFTDALIAPLTVQYSDTSTGTALSWDWDLDGDGTTDSTAQNPTFVYPDTSPVTVTLTASRLCGPPDTIMRTLVPSQYLTTTFANNIGGGSGWTMYFDMDVLSDTGLAISGFDVNSSSAASTPFSIDVYLTNTTYVGKEQTPEAWGLLGTASGTTAGNGLPSPTAFSTPAYVALGNYGIAIHYRGAAPAYTRGNGNNQAYANADLALDLGISRNTTAGQPFGAATTFDPRVWNGTIYYQTCTISSAAGYGYAGTGCAGTNGISLLTSQSNPVLGTTLNVDVSNLPLGVAVMMTGLSNTSSVLGPLPLDGTPFGAPGCALRVSPDSNLLILGAGNTATWSLTIPNDPGLTCLQLFQQAVALDPGINAAGATLSNAAGLVIGN